MKEFIESYYHQVFSAVNRLVGLNSEEEIDILTREIIQDLWERKSLLEAETRKGVYIYKLVLAHVLKYLKARGEENKIKYLQNILPISPVNYAQLSEDAVAKDAHGNDTAGAVRAKNENPLRGATLQGDVGI